jgi:peroxiredoxin Q/BCP
MKLQVGDQAPAFALADQSGKQHTLAGYAGRKLLIYFYPKADTPGCTRQSCAVRDAKTDISKLAMDVVGVSPDAAAAQQKFDDKFELGFPLLCDTEKTMAEAYDVWVEKKNYGRTYMGINRSSFLVDENGNLAGVWYGVKPEDTVPQALAAAAP